MVLRRAIMLVSGLLSLTEGETLWWIDVRPLPQWIVALPGAILLVALATIRHAPPGRLL